MKKSNKKFQLSPFWCCKNLNDEVSLKLSSLKSANSALKSSDTCELAGDEMSSELEELGVSFAPLGGGLGPLRLQK